MKEETTSKYTVSVREILRSLNITGDVLSCGFNLKKKINDPLNRELTVIVAKKGKVTIMREMTIQVKKKKAGEKKK